MDLDRDIWIYIEICKYRYIKRETKRQTDRPVNIEIGRERESEFLWLFTIMIIDVSINDTFLFSQVFVGPYQGQLKKVTERGKRR